ncbi:MAG: sensor histidine kinase [Flammeovirgaceae bacterium]
MKLSNWKIAILNVLVGFSIIAFIWYSEEGEWVSLLDEARLLPSILLVINLIGFSMKFASQGLANVFPWKKYFGLRFCAEILSRNAIVLIISYFLIAISVKSTNWNIIWEFCLEYSLVLMNASIIIFIVNLFLTIGTFTLYAHNQYSIVQIQSVELKRTQLQLQFDALRSQLSPHYLFNCLNTVSNLVYKDAQLAEEFIRRFAQTYQYVLEKHEEELVKVYDEIEFIKSFHFLLKTRFGAGLQLSIDLPEEVLESQIPPLTLQILVENAVKHNIISPASPLHIKIIADTSGNLLVTNNITRQPAHATSLKVGLNNIKKRYAYFTKRAIQITQENNFHVQLPILTLTTAKP